MKKKIAIIIVAFLTSAVGVGAVRLSGYSTHSEKKAPPVLLPLEFQEEASVPVPKMLVFIHPQCPGQQTTLAALSKLATDDFGLVDVRVLFYLPENRSAEWAAT